MLFLITVAGAQDKPEFNIKPGGTIQTLFRYARINLDTTQIGFTLARVRAIMSGEYSEFLKFYIQFGLNSPKLLDARIDFIASKLLIIRLGRFKGAGVRAGGLTSHTDIDIVERPASAVYWAIATVGLDYRDYGIAFLGEINNFHYNLTIHNGSGTKDINNLFLSIPSSMNQGLAISGMIFYKPLQLNGFESGGYYGIGNKYINDYYSYNAYVYYEPLPYRLKAELISFTNKNGKSDTTALGYYVFGAYRFAKHFEGLARFEVFDSNINTYDNKETHVTLGFTYSFFPYSWQTARITAAYVNRQGGPRGYNNHIIYILTQIAF